MKTKDFLSGSSAERMETIKLAYRDNDRTPVIFCIKEMAKRHYEIDVEVKQIRGSKEYEAALFDGSADVIIEHLDYLYERAARGAKITMFCAPSQRGGLKLVSAPQVKGVEDLRGRVLAVRAQGQPYGIALWLRMMDLEKDVTTVLVGDDEVGRWGQWKKVISGECVATFMSPIYLPAALSAGLTVLLVRDLPVIGHFAQACRSEFARERPDTLKRYVGAVIHALCLMTLRPEEALKIVSQEPMRLMGVQDSRELRRQFDSIAGELNVRPYPTPEAIANTHEIAAAEYPDAKELNPMVLWDLHWVKELDDEGSIDQRIREMSR